MSNEASTGSKLEQCLKSLSMGDLWSFPLASAAALLGAVGILATAYKWGARSGFEKGRKHEIDHGQVPAIRRDLDLSVRRS